MKRHVLAAACAFLLATPSFAQVKLISPDEVNRLSQSQPAQPRPPRLTPEPAQGAGRVAGQRSSAGLDLLPREVPGWTAAGPLETFGQFNASTLAGQDARLLVEYGFAGAERRRFTRGSQILALEAIRFRDSSGSYGAYSFYRGEDWDTRDGDWQLAQRGAEFMARKDEALIRASATGGPPLADSEITAIIESIVTAGGGRLPTLPAFLPQAGLRSKSRKYILGPLAFARLVPDLPVALADFEMGAEAAVGSYNDGLRMLLVSYLTPQLAAQKIRAWQEASRSGTNGAPPTILFARRSGALVAFVTGASAQAQAEPLLQAVNHSMELTWNERVPKTSPMNLGQFLMGMSKLIGALLLFAVFAGLGFGLVRAFVQSRYPNLVFDRPEESEIIRLNIRYTG